ncbi:GNAT family N-acetyltransferase [Marinobacter sp.]|uniref:GNAT family N-acetyltransferase n=1 Tax=Marinobacter sp. TaxID=50741 RepID=UPI003567A871
MTGHPASRGLDILTTSCIADIGRDHWQSFSGAADPLISYDFLEALETSGAVSRHSGWQPCHLKLYLDGQWVGVAPAYRKYHSMGEYVFDWAWADAWQRHGLAYYPKLLIAVPFTPCQGRRLLLREEVRHRLAASQLHQALDQLMPRLGVHSWHLLFPDEADQFLLDQPGSLHRLGCQFHWYNRGYGHFEDFLATLTSRKRKSLRRERRQVAEQGIGFRQWAGDSLPDEVLDDFFLFYNATYLKRGMRPYLNRDFFSALARRLGPQLRLITAELSGKRIAAALFIIGDRTLYGRYWGCLEDYNHLHFETCYYQGIDLAIAEGLSRFDAGAQGEHKLVRGFEPVLTHSWHNVDHPGFREAVADFCEEEAVDVEGYRRAAMSALPYRQEESG